jgi:hypothetical protein
MPKKPKPKHPNWGGRRPGAGAPKGNMNALKHGRRSRRINALGRMVASDPKWRADLLAIADKWDRKHMKAREVANEIFTQVIERGLRVGEQRSGKPNRATAADIFADPSRLRVGPPIAERPSIEIEGSAPNVAADTPTKPEPREKISHRPDNQAPRTTHRRQSRSVRQNPLD